MEGPSNGQLLHRPLFYNFTVIPKVTEREEFWKMKKNGTLPKKEYEDILVFKNTGMGIYISIFGFLAGFALVWHILWLTVLGIIGVIACVIIRSFDDDTEYVLSAEEAKKIDTSKVQG